MGFCNSWVAIQGMSRATVLERFELEETPERGDAIEVAKPLSYAELPAGWLVVFGPYDWATVDRVRDLSKAGPAIGMILNDKVDLESTVFAARDGELLWEVSAMGEELTVRGSPPPEFERLRRHYTSEDAREEHEDWAIHELAIELARTVTGFRADDEQPIFAGLKPIKGGASESLGRSGCLGVLLAPLVIAAFHYGHAISIG